MKKVATFLLLFIITNSLVFSQTYKQYPINTNAKYPLINFAIYENQIALIGLKNYENIIQVYLYKNNQWDSLPTSILINGDEQYIPFENSIGFMIPRIVFDKNGSLWIVAINGLYNLVGNQWIRYRIENVNHETTKYMNLVFDKLGRSWVIAHVSIGEGQESQSGTRLYRFENGKFYPYLEQYSFFPNDLPLMNESFLASKDVYNSGTLIDGIMFFGDKRYLGQTENGESAEIVYTTYDGTSKLLTIPTIDKPIYSSSLKKLNRIYVDSQNRVFFLMRFQQNMNQSTGVISQCCSGIARLDNTSEWYTYTKENNTPFSQDFNDAYIRYATPVDMCELNNNEYLFVMQNNGDSEPKNLQLYKLNNENKFEILQWKSYLQHSTIYRSDFSSITEENLKKEIDILINEELVSSKLDIKRMLTDIHGNIWIAGENFIIKMTDDPKTSATESITKPIIIYPNPGNKSIRLSNGGGEVSKIEILNVTGTVVRTVMENSMEIPISEFTNGMYFVKIYAQNGNIEVLKFIKN